MRKSPRDRRLNSDFQSVQTLKEESSIFSFDGRGTPPQKYRLVFVGTGFQRDRNGNISISNYHEVLVELGAAYPRMVPNLAWQTPIFHPNISNNGVVCLGGYGTHWVPSLTLSEMCTMLWDMIRYKNFDTESPYNREAALWAKTQTDYVLPIDNRSIRDRVSGQKVAPPRKQVSVTRVVDATSVQPPIQTPNQTQPNETCPQVDSDDIEIIETGIEIIGQSNETNNGIVFLD